MVPRDFKKAKRCQEIFVIFGEIKEKRIIDKKQHGKYGKLFDIYGYVNNNCYLNLQMLYVVITIINVKKGK